MVKENFKRVPNNRVYIRHDHRVCFVMVKENFKRVPNQLGEFDEGECIEDE